MNIEKKVVSERYVIGLLKELEFEPLALPNLPQNTPLIYVLEERIRNVRDDALIKMVPSIALVEKVDKIKAHEDGVYSIQYTGEFRYYGIGSEDEFIFLGGGNIISPVKDEGRIRQVFDKNCFTAPRVICERYMPRKKLTDIILPRSNVKTIRT